MPQVLVERYELGRVIGAGGMAKVHLGTDRFLDRPVAVKVLDDVAARSADPASRERFLKEARSAAGFTHHNAVSVYDAGQDDGVLFIVMEYVAGETLATRLANDTVLPIGDAVSFSTQILEALGAMHERGLLHRDVKPANVMLTDVGQVKLTDFGIAKRLDDIDEALTSAGTVVGTPRYLAPEQAVGGELGPTTDVYLTGIVLHEMLTGERPPSALLGVPLRSPDPRRMRADVPERLAEVVTRALEYRPERRWPDARAMIDALRVAVDGKSFPTSASPSERRADDESGDTRAIPATAGHDQPTQVVRAAVPTPDDRGESTPADGATRTTHDTASLPAGSNSGYSFALWVPIMAIVVVLALVGFALARAVGDGADDGNALEQLSSVEFLAELRADPERFGERGAEVRDQLVALLATADPADRAAAREALEVDIFVWVTDGELDTSVGAQIARVLDG